MKNFLQILIKKNSPSVGETNPLFIISCCSNNEFIECLCKISGPVNDLGVSGLGQSLKFI